MQHLDELTLTLIADGEDVAPEAAAHAAVCATCAARVEAIRADSLVLGASLALDAADLQFLSTAGLPQLLATQAAEAARLTRREQVGGLFWSVLPLTLAYAGWLVVSPWLWRWVDLLRQAGGTAVAIRAIADFGLRLADWLASVVEAASTVPGFDAPLVSLSLVAALTYAALLLIPRRGAAAAPASIGSAGAV